MNSSTNSVLDIRHPEKSDHQQIHDVVRDAFSQEAEAVLVDVIRGASDVAFELSAFLADELVGHVLLSPIKIDPPSAIRCLGIAPLSVLSRMHGGGVGSALMRHAIDESARRGIDDQRM